jgi:hypothetical protein
MRTATLLSVVGLACLLACGKKEAPAVEPAPAAPVAPAAAAAPAPGADPSVAAPSSIEEPTFALRMAGAGPYKAGELGRFVLQIEPRGEFHINMEYPVEIAVTGSDGTTFPKANLMKPDAAEFGEKKARFEVPFTASAAGDHKVNCNVKFAVCTDENCVPDERNLTLALAVN